MMILFDGLMTVYQCCLVLYVLKKQFVQKPHLILWEIGCIVMMTVGLMIIQTLNLPIPDTLMFVIPFIYIKMTTEDRLLTCTLWIVIDAFLTLGTLALVSSLFDIQIAVNGDVLSASYETMMIYSFAGNAAIAVVLCIAARIAHVRAMIAQLEEALFLVMLLFCFAISELCFTARVSEDNRISLVAGSAIAFVLMILIIVLYEHMTQTARKQKQAEMAAQTMQLRIDHQDELREIYECMMAQEHDMRHRIAAVEELLTGTAIQEDQRQKLVSLLEDASDSHSQVFLTGSMAADAILTAKAAIMEKAGIQFVLTEYPLTNLPFSEHDFCVLLGNLLDNAIEGVMALPAGAKSRSIHLAFSKVWNMLFISCKNDADLSKIRRRGDKFLSTKSRPELHGFGIDSMCQIVNKTNGTIEIDTSNGQFAVEIMLGDGGKC